MVMNSTLFDFQYALQALDEFYENLDSVGVSAITGEGMEDLFKAVDKSREDYDKFYKVELDKRLQALLDKT